MGNESTALMALGKLEGGASLSEVLSQHDLEFEVEVLPGITALAAPKIEEDGRAHLRGTVQSEEHGEFEFHLAARPEAVESVIREAVRENLPLRVAAWWQSTFQRSPILKRVIVADGPKKIGAMGPRRLLMRGF